MTTSTVRPAAVDGLAIVLFGILTVFTLFQGVRLAGVLVSLLPLVAGAAYMVLGPVITAWLFWAAAWLKGLFLLYLASRAGSDVVTKKGDIWARTAVNATMMPAGILFGSFVFAKLTELFPSSSTGYPVFILFWGVGYFFINYLFVIFFFALQGKKVVQHFWRNMLRPVLYEAVLVPFAPLIARIYSDLGWDYFLFLMLGLVILAFAFRYLNEIGLNLNRRVMELDSLKKVGQTMSAGLELESVLAAIHTQVSRLMPAHTFYIALFDAVKNEVTFPFAVEGGQRKSIAARQGGNGLVEYVLREKRPLLIPKNVSTTAQTLNLTLLIGEPACWLGVPIMLADDLIGAITVQSYEQSSLYDDWHQDVLMTIATQAAVVIHNAWLYAQTDSELTRRVQELNSILSTIHEGILLVSLDGTVLTTNRIFTEFTGLTDGDLIGRSLFDGDGDSNLLGKIGYELSDWQQDCDAVIRDEKWLTTRITMTGTVTRQVERTLVPVRNNAANITGWLLIFRDITEEIELAKAREETIHMLVHDLRSPLSVTLGSLQTIDAWLEMGRTEDVGRLLDLANTGGQRMLQLLNNLLDSYKFENGDIPLNREPISALLWLTDVKKQFAPAATNAGLTIEVDVEPGLPMIWADKEHMVRVLSNLVDNAVKFTPDGGQIMLWAKWADDEDNPVWVGVSDTGAGIPLEQQSKLFVKFQQNAALRGRRQGTGLGLTYCKLVVEAHNGRIWVESEGIEGKGSTLVMALPAFDESRSRATATLKERVPTR
ncbi:MAG: GAF domain-containing protein [Ardenticatenaceae bacterium]|nr:GAF domain-containing protein [Ardenticatenaceae bacterium]